MTETTVTETKVTHTPAPWTVRGRDVYGAGCKVSECPSRLRTPGSTVADQQALANARLIAGAPDLLAALKAMVASYDGLRDGLTSPVVLDKLARADAAIAKAEGGAQ